MPIPTGTLLGPYEIAAPLGAGGMGEVYRARDTRLDRTVAVKVLPELLAVDPEFEERFDREARAISQLTHPHVCALYDVGRHERTRYLVLEYLDGETLAARIAKSGPMPLAQALKTAAEIASALDAAHRSGIVHRDLKPGNVMMTKGGAKLLDFGLAKSRTAQAGQAGGAGRAGGYLSAADLSAPTMATPLTTQGSIIGTFQYMSPEQIEGHEADHRSDVFAFGCVLYEMLTGKKAFTGKTQASLISAILKDHPAPLAIDPVTPAGLDRVVRTCLAKNADDRWQHAGDLHRELTWLAGEPAAVAPVGVGPRSNRRERIAVVVASILGATAIGLAWLLWQGSAGRGAPVRQQTMHLAVALDPARPIARIDNAASNDPHPSLALSPDGALLVYAADAGGVSRLVVHDLTAGTSTPIAGTEGGVEPFFSPDGNWVGFWADRKLKKVALRGGAPVTLIDAPFLRGAHWYEADAIVYVPDLYSGVWKIRPVSGGKPEQVTTVNKGAGELSHRWPDVLPGGRALLYTVGKGGSFDDAHIVVHSLETGQARVIVEGGQSPRYVPTGHIVYARAGVLTAVPFDATRLEVSGAPAKVKDDVMRESSGAAQYAFSASGVFASLPVVPEMQNMMVWSDRAGNSTRLPGAPGSFARLALSPDGRRVALGNSVLGDVTVRDLDRGTEWSLRPRTRANYFSWTPDGNRLVFGSETSGSWNLVVKRADGSGDEEPLLPPGPSRNEFDLSRDGKWLVYGEQKPTGENAPWVMSLADRKPSLIDPGISEDVRHPSVSWDGKYMAMAIGDSGRSQVFVQTLPSGERVRVSTDGGTEPRWSPDGRELFFRHGDQLMVAAVGSRGGALDVGVPRSLFRASLVSLGGLSYSVSPDGRRFLTLQTVGDPVALTRLDLITNWFAELRRLTAAR